MLPQFPRTSASLSLLLGNSCSSLLPEDAAEMCLPRPQHGRESLASFTADRKPLEVAACSPGARGAQGMPRRHPDCSGAGGAVMEG